LENNIIKANKKKHWKTNLDKGIQKGFGKSIKNSVEKFYQKIVT
jgi:hypothetical protein